MYSTTCVTYIRSITAVREITDDKYQGCNPFSGMHGTMEDYRGVFSFSIFAVNVYSSYFLALSWMACENYFWVGFIPELEIWEEAEVFSIRVIGIKPSEGSRALRES